MLLQKHRSYSEVYNDKWDIVVNVFRVLRDPDQAAELRRRIILTPFSRTEFESCNAEDIARDPDPIERARMTIFRSFAGFGSAATNGNRSTGFRSNSSRSYTTPAHDWVYYPDHIESYTNRLRGVIIENRCALKVMTQHDSDDTLHYVDPPYVHDTRNMRRGNASYAYEMTDDEHRKLAATLHELAGMVVLSGYECDLYDELFSDWRKVRRHAYADGARDRTECLWLNPQACRRQSQLSLF